MFFKIQKNFAIFTGKELCWSLFLIKLQAQGVFLLITWLTEICLTSLIALFWNFTLMICNFPLLFSHSKNNLMSTLITIIITYYLLTIIIIIITKSPNNYCSVGVKELYLLNLLILIVFCVILTLVCSLRACHMWLSRNHMFICEIWGKFTSFLFWNFEISLASLERFQNFKKSELGKFIPNLPLKHVITSTNIAKFLRTAFFIAYLWWLLLILQNFKRIVFRRILRGLFIIMLLIPSQ